MKQCPHCLKKVSETARKCKFCGEWVVENEDIIHKNVEVQKCNIPYLGGGEKNDDNKKGRTPMEFHVKSEKEKITVNNKTNNNLDKRSTIAIIGGILLICIIIFIPTYYKNNILSEQNTKIENLDNKKFHEDISEEDFEMFLKIADIYQGFIDDEINLEAYKLKNVELIKSVIKKLEENKRLMEVSMDSFKEYGNNHGLFDKTGEYSYSSFINVLGKRYDAEKKYFNTLIDYYNYIINIQNKFSYNEKDGELYVNDNSILPRINEYEDNIYNTYDEYQEIRNTYSDFINELFKVE